MKFKHDSLYEYKGGKTHYIIRDLAGYAVGKSLCGGRVEKEDLAEPNYENICANCSKRAKKLRITFQVEK